MNKFGIVLGAAALAVVAGCKDPNYVPPAQRAQNKAKKVVVEPTPAQPVVTPDVTPAPVEEPAPVIGVEEITVPEPVPAKEVKVEELPPAPVPETTPYIVQRGDYLAKISKKFNVKLDALRKANPQLKNDVVRLGQTIQIPGKVDVGVQTIPEGAIAKPPAKPKAEYKPYTGQTQEYVVKSGDYLGKIAVAHKTGVRQIKELNGLTSDVVRVGQKLRVPAVASSAPAAVPAAPAPKAASVAEVRPVAPVTTEELDKLDAEANAVVPEAPAEVAVPVEEPATEASAAADESVVPYVVQEGEDIIALSISFGVDPAVIREINNMNENDQIKAGQVIKLPAGRN